MENMSMSIRIKLSVMMFLQFMLFAVWWVPLAAYLDEIGVTNKKHIFNTMAFGCMAAPIIGMFADRHFASQKILAILNIATAVLLFAASTQTDSTILFVLLLAAMLCYMPTWALTSSIAMSNSPAELFPQIRVFGSIGWVAAGLFSIVALKVLVPLKLINITDFDSTRFPMLCGAVCSLIAAGVNFTLPNTPPPAKGQKASVIDALGLKAVTLLKDANFATFIFISTLVMTPFMIWFNYGSQFLKYEGFKYLTVTMNIGQFAEMFFMLLIPLALARMGIKWALVAGLIALLVRYITFWCGGVNDMQWVYFIGILVHGIIFGFFFVGGQIYVDKKANPEIRSQAQGLLFLVTFGIGSLLANTINDFLINHYTTGDETNWNSIWKVTTIFSVVLLAAFLVLFRDKLDQPSEEAVKEAVKEISEEEIV
jgi:nucleoside transporter